MTEAAALFAVPPTPPRNLESSPPGEIETAVIELFDDLEERGLLGAIEKAKKAALIKASRSLDHGLHAGKASVATSNVLKQVFEAFDTLPIERTGDVETDALDATLQRLTVESFETDYDDA